MIIIVDVGVVQGTIRMAKLIQIFVGVDCDIESHLVHWHHMDCFLSFMHHEGVAPEQLRGFTSLGDDGMRVLQEKFRDFVERIKR